MKGPVVMVITASQHNAAACLMPGDQLVVAISEERLSRIKRQGVCGARPSLAFDYCLAAAGVTQNQLDKVVLCTQTSCKSPEHDVRSNSQLAALVQKKRAYFISHHLGHALSTLRWAGTGSAAIFVADGLESPWDDLPANERAVADKSDQGLSETLSMYTARNWRLTPLKKHFVAAEVWLTADAPGMPSYGSLGGMYSAVAEYIFGDAMEAGKVMGLAAFARPSISTDRFRDIGDTGIAYHSHVSRRF